MNISETNFTVDVASSIGTTEVNLFIAGLVALLCIKAPNANTLYDIAVYDMQDFLIYAEQGLKGDASVVTERLCKSKVKVKVLNSTVDGSFTFRGYMQS